MESPSGRELRKIRNSGYLTRVSAPGDGWQLQLLPSLKPFAWRMAATDKGAHELCWA